MSETDPKIYIVIPAYNEGKVIEQTILSLKNERYSNILVVNDGSSDKTKENAHLAGAEVIDHIINRGQGAALRTGIEYLRENSDPDIIVTFDADGQHQAKDIQKFVELISKGECDIALGSRFLAKKSNIPRLRKIILKLGVIFTRFISDIAVTDTHNGFRALGRKAIQSIEITQRGMEHASEIIDEIKKRKLSFKEVPVEVIYTEYSKIKGQKNSNFVKIGIKMILKKLL